MTMFRLYLEILNFNVALSVFAVVTVSMVSGRALTSQDFIFPVAIQLLLTSLVFILRELLRRHDARIAARVLVQRTGTQLAALKTALRNQGVERPEFSKGYKTWNS
jgi:hypothetical protein